MNEIEMFIFYLRGMDALVKVGNSNRLHLMVKRVLSKSSVKYSCRNLVMIGVRYVVRRLPLRNRKANTN